MIRIAVAFAGETAEKSVISILEKNGLPVRFRCHTGAEVIRAINKMGGGVVICGFKLPDMTADQLAEELAGQALFLVLAKAGQLELCENEELFTLPLPIKAGELTGGVDMLVQLDQKQSTRHASKRTPNEDALIERAKTLLMESSGMSEERAHRYIQRRSMDCGAKMADTAKLILLSLE